MPDIARELDQFISELDAAVAAHLDWTRRVMRCAVLRTSPGEDVISPIAHTLCRFGRWVDSRHQAFGRLDEEKSQTLLRVHEAMHDVIRNICTDILAGRPGNADHLAVFEQTQAELIELMAWFKTHFIEHAMRKDPLTSLPTRYGMKAEFDEALRKSRRDKTRLYMAMIDADHFKRINDEHGHTAGDRVLQHLARTLRVSVRPYEGLYRYGGEEFLLLMQCHSVEAAEAAATRIVHRIRHMPAQLDTGIEIALTVTVGLAGSLEGEPLESLIERSDQAMYAGKLSGRNCYKVAPDNSNSSPPVVE